MPERKGKTLEDLQKDRLRAEIRKLQAETKKLSPTRKQSIKDKKWYQIWDLLIKMIGFFIAIIMIIAAVVSIIIPLTQTSNQLAKYKIELAEAKHDSALFAKRQAEIKEMKLREHIQAITSRLDSLKEQQNIERGLIANQLANEKAKSERNRKKVNELELQLKSKESQINKIKKDTEKIKEIIAPLVEVKFDFEDFHGKMPTFKIYLNDILKATTNEKIYRLKIKEGIYSLKILYTSGNKIWEYSEKNITFQAAGSELVIYGNMFK